MRRFLLIAALAVTSGGVASAAPPAQGKLVPIPQVQPPVPQGKGGHPGRGIGPEVSAAARNGVHGQQLASYAHFLQGVHGIGPVNKANGKGGK